MHVVPTEGVQRRFANQPFEIRADEPVRAFGERFDIDVVGQGCPASQNPKDLLAAVPIWNADFDLAIEPARSAQCRVQRLRLGRRSDDDESVVGPEIVHKRNQRPDTVGRGPSITPRPGDRVEFVDEDDHGFVCSGVLEPVSEPLLRFVAVCRTECGAADGFDVNVRLVRNRLENERLPRSRRAVQQHAVRRFDTETAERVGRTQRQFDGLSNLCEFCVQAADVGEGGPGRIGGAGDGSRKSSAGSGATEIRVQSRIKTASPGDAAVMRTGTVRRSGSVTECDRRVTGTTCPTTTARLMSSSRNERSRLLTPPNPSGSATVTLSAGDTSIGSTVTVSPASTPAVRRTSSVVRTVSSSISSVGTICVTARSPSGPRTRRKSPLSRASSASVWRPTTVRPRPGSRSSSGLTVSSMRLTRVLVSQHV